MKNRFLILYSFLAGIFMLANTSAAYSQSFDRDLYELKIYHLKNQEQEKQVDKFLKEAYLPALNRAGIGSVGVFKPVEGDSAYGKKIYVYIPYSSPEMFLKVPQALEKDKKYKEDGSGYLNAPHNNPPYSRIETTLLWAFEGMPRFQPNKLSGSPSDKIYELRSYEGATEKLYRNKVDMFNKGEIEIFNRLGFYPMFFGEVIAGANMPNLMYMTAFSDKASRDAHWKAFGEDPAWKKMRSMEEYQNNVSHADIILLHPTPYSGL